MSDQEWYRKTSWTDLDKHDFFVHFQRSRKSSRGEYLRIQAVHLYDTDRLFEINAALELINLALAEYPSQIELAPLLELKAECLKKLGKENEAEVNYLSALQTMREFPQVQPNVPFSFGLFVLEYKKPGCIKK